MTPTIQPPLSRKHQIFADQYLAHGDHTAAYFAAGYRPRTHETARVSACRLAKRKDVAAYIRAIQKKVAMEVSVLAHLETRQFLARIVRVPLAKLSFEEKDDPNGDLIKSYSLNESESSSHYRIEKLDPLKAIEIDMKLSGADPATNAIEELATAIAACAPASPLPTGTL